MILCHCRVGIFMKLIDTVRSTAVSIGQIESMILFLLFANSRTRSTVSGLV